MVQDVEKFYSSYVWYDDPFSKQGAEYYQQTLINMKQLVDADFFKKLLLKDSIKILELCAGVGYGGIAISKMLLNKGKDIELMVTDVRDKILVKAKKFGEQELSMNISTSIIDVKDPQIESTYDIILIYGLSMPHINPWEASRLFHVASQYLASDGLFVIHETDRRLLEFLERDYQKIALAGNDNQPLVNVHSGYDLLRGTIQRTYYGLNRMVSPATTDAFFWSIAELSSLMWTAFEDINYLKLGQYKFFVIGLCPRRVLSDSDFKLPDIFSAK